MKTLFPRRVRISIIGILALVTLCVYFYGGSLRAAVASGVPCHVYDVGSPIPAGFAAPWDVFAATLLMKVSCGATADLSVSGTAATYIWKTAYMAASGVGSWTAVPLEGSNRTADGNWLISNASASLPTSAADLNQTNHALAYICTYKNEAWQCGCNSASSCTAGKYSLQRFTNAEPSGSGSTMSCNANPMDVQMVLDRSGSMDGQKIADAKAAANSFIDLVRGPNNHVGVTYFGSSATLGAALSSNFDGAKAIVTGIIVVGKTNIGDGVRIAQQDVAANGRAGTKHVIVLLTDGKANRPEGLSVSPETYAEQEAGKAKTAGTIVYVIGLGSDVNATSLQRMATTPSHYYFAPSGGDLQGIYDAIIARECTQSGVSVSGLKIFDRNSNGSRDAEDTGLAGWTIVLKDQSGAEKARTLTNASGMFLFSDIAPGNYSVCEVTGSAWRQTSPSSGCHALTIGGQNVSNILFLNTPQSPTLTFTADATTVAYNTGTMLRWAAQNVGACAASGAWGGGKSLSGVESTGNLSTSKTYTLTCTGVRGSVTKSVTVGVSAPPPDFALANQRNIEVQFSSTGAKTTNETVITVLPSNGFSGTVALSAAPSIIGGVTPVFNFSDAALSPLKYSTGSRFSITFPSSIAPGNYAVQITGVSGSLARVIDLTVKVTGFTPVIFEE